MASFCTCCGAEITLKAAACPACGNPRHGMLQSNLLTRDAGAEPFREDAEIDRKLPEPLPVSGGKSTAKPLQRP